MLTFVLSATASSISCTEPGPERARGDGEQDRFMALRRSPKQTLTETQQQAFSPHAFYRYLELGRSPRSATHHTVPKSRFRSLQGTGQLQVRDANRW
uniref:Uncharacterized protein n=1 Tax=Arundo donax TaxID=35708 RepID=A0A0A8Y3Z1_ARUDO